MSNPGLFLEILNGGAVTPESLWLVLLAIYLSKESKRRGLRCLDWFHLPPSMNLIVAIFVCDAGISLRSFTIWTWRRFFSDGGHMNGAHAAAMILGSCLVLIGTLCKVRAITEPDHGKWPWIFATISTAAVILALIIFR